MHVSQTRSCVRVASPLGSWIPNTCFRAGRIILFNLPLKTLNEGAFHVFATIFKFCTTENLLTFVLISKVDKETSTSMIHCQCNHMTSFAADFFIPPNPIDIDKVIEGFKNITDNLSVVVLISLLMGFYILLLVYLRRIDKRDAEKVCLRFILLFLCQ